MAGRAGMVVLVAAVLVAVLAVLAELAARPLPSLLFGLRLLRLRLPYLRQVAFMFQT
jgi:hypothetical protein